MDEVKRRIQQGEFPPLTVNTLEEEIEGLREDLLNWDHGHELVVSELEIMERLRD